MSDQPNASIFASMRQKETDELLRIWARNDRAEWTAEAFEVIRQVLEERQVEVPPQGEPLEEGGEPEEESEQSLAELWAILAEKEPPEFYNAKEVLALVQRMQKFAKIALVVTVITALPYLLTYQYTVHTYFSMDPDKSWLAWIIALVFWVLLAGFSAGLYFYGFKAVAFVLQMLLEMEFRSRE